MARIVLLDAGPLGLLCVRPGVALADRRRLWLSNLSVTAADVVISGVAEYAVRREMLRVGATEKLKNLDDLAARCSCLAPTETAWRLAAEFWCAVRRFGKPTAHPEALDADCLLAAQASLLGDPGDHVTIATTNVRHLNRFPGIDAKEWDKIAP